MAAQVPSQSQSWCSSTDRRVAQIARPSVSDTSQRFIRLREVIAITGKSKTSIYGAMSRGEFPLALAIGERSRARVKVEVLDWMRSRVNARRAAAESRGAA